MPLPHFFRTTAFKLTAIYMAVFIAFTGAVFGYLFYTVNERLYNQLDETIKSEIAALRDHYEQRGVRGLLDRVQSRSFQPGAPALLVTNFQGRGLTGNIPNLPPDFLSLDRRSLHPLPYDRAKADGEVERTLAMVRIFDLPGGFYLVIGRDVGEREEFKRILSGLAFIALAALVVLGFLSWYLVGRRVLNRLDMMAATSQKIVAGNLSERLIVEGSGDEFDRLAGNLNNMLNRIEALLVGLKDVSDNIAHDLKTPLTRMRNRIEGALSGKVTKQEMRGVLEETISESDNLIKIFDALLRIARVEAGSSFEANEMVELNDLISDVTELYDPLAEEEDVLLVVKPSDQKIELQGNRELISQAVANLLDNAIKYGRPHNEEPSKVCVLLTIEKKSAVISVTDNGDGIDPQDYEKITKRFTRLEPSRSKPGSGLGLSLVSAVAKLHGGMLSFDDNKPGLTVRLSLPL